MRKLLGSSHEIAGTAVRVGSQVPGIKVGDRVGVGAQIASCYDCALCTHDNENYCPKRIDTYGDKYPDGVVRLPASLVPSCNDQRLATTLSAPSEGTRQESLRTTGMCSLSQMA